MSVEKKANGRYLARWRDPSGKQRAQHVRPQGRRRPVPRDGDGRPVARPLRRPERGQADRRGVRSAVGGRPAVAGVDADEPRVRDRAPDRPGVRCVQLRAVRPSDVQAWVGRLSASGLAASSVGTYFRVLAQMMIAARRDRLIHESPCVGVRLPRADRAASSLTVLSAAQVAALADEVPEALPSPRRSSLRASGYARAKRAPSPSTASTSCAARSRSTARSSRRRRGASATSARRRRRRSNRVHPAAVGRSPRCSPHTSPSSARDRTG